ncbi:MAG: sigma-70 family RNA polymerase sigma factor [Bacteroidota bacterium]
MNINTQLSTWWDESRDGNVASFGLIHHQLYPALNHYLLKIIKDDDICQDILQDLFIKLWERKAGFGPIQYVKVYFFRSARSMAINYLKSQKNHTPLDDGHLAIDMEFSPEEVMVGLENDQAMNHLLASALNTLPKRQREMIFLKYFDGWNYDQIAEVTGIKYQSVVNHVHRAVIQLRQELTSDRQMQDCRIAV